MTGDKLLIVITLVVIGGIGFLAFKNRATLDRQFAAV